MNSKLLSFSFLSAIGLIGLATSLVFAQQPAAQPVATPPPVQPRAENPAFIYGGPGRPGFAGSTYSPDDPRLPILQRLNELKVTLGNAAEGETDAIVADIETTLGEYFDSDLEHRRAELQRLTERADETEALNERRQESRDELIDLQFEAFVQEVDGLELGATVPGVGYPPPVPYGAGSAAPSGVIYQSVPGGSVREVVVTPGSGGPAPGVVIAANPNDPASGVVIVAGEDALLAAMHRIHAARQALSTAADADTETTAKDELKAALGEYFDRDMEHRTSELAGVRTGLTALESKISERADARDDVIAIQLKMIVNEAAGLGFFSGGNAGIPAPIDFSGRVAPGR